MEKLEIIRDYNVIAIEINIIKDHTNKVLLNSAVEIGKRLKEAKGIAGHGNWSKWLEEEVNYSQRTATNLMRIYEEYSPQLLENETGNRIADLGYTQAIAMLKLDFEDRENLMIEEDVEEMSVKELEEVIREKLELKKEKEALEKQLGEQTEKESKLAKEIEQKLEEIKDYESLVKDKTKEIKELNAIAQKSSSNPEELEKLKKKMADKKDEIKELKKQLKEKPIETEVEVERIIEVVPDSLQNELEDLRSKLDISNSKLNSSEGIAKFKSTFSIVVNLFNDLIESLEDIEKEDAGEAEKYKAAVNKLLNKLIIE